MRVDNSSALSDLVNWWLSRRRSTPVSYVGTRREPTFATPTPLADTPQEVSHSPVTTKKHQSPSTFEWRPVDTTGQTDFGGADLPPAGYFTPDSPKKRRRKDQNQKAIEAVRAYTLANGKPPAFSVVVSDWKLPKSTASRIRREVMREFAVVQ